MSQVINLPPLLVVVGETAVGKSELAIKLASKLNGEIICADSWTVRKELNIGTDKPSKEDQLKVNHHLLDIINPCSDFTAAVFKTLALESIHEIASRHKLPIMVGGSGLYIDSVIFDYSFLKPSDPAVRQRLNTLSIEQLLGEASAKGLKISENIDIRNKRRLIRLIENEGALPKKGKFRDRTLIIGIKQPTNGLMKSIEERVDKMLRDGLEKEVKQLSDKYGWQCEALKGVGYKQWHGYFVGNNTIEETRAQIISATNNLAKKQRTWFKRNKSIHWLKQPVVIEKVVELITTELAI
ncbi:MAG: tRNA (adenosine(37)-N6)-dimethylallyltransferase MiaA [Candidatus Saccharimonadales bacterium]